MKYPWWKTKKCKTCKAKIPKNTESAELRLDTAEGIVTLEICNECAEFLDKSAEALGKGRPRIERQEREDSESSSEDD